MQVPILSTFFSTLFFFFLPRPALSYPFSPVSIFSPLAPPPDCHYTAPSGPDRYINFASPNESAFRFSISTEWTHWYPTVLRSALAEAGFTLQPPNDSNACGWVHAGKVRVGGWNHGVVWWKDVSQKARSVGWNAMEGEEVAGARRTEPQELRRGQVPLYMHVGQERLLAAANAWSPTKASAWSKRNATLQPVETPTRQPQPQTLDLVRTILINKSAGLDIAIFLLEIVGCTLGLVFAFCLLVWLGQCLGRLLERRIDVYETESEVELDSFRESGNPFADPVRKPEVVRVVAKGEESGYWGMRRVSVPMSSSVYSRSVDGVTLYGQ